MRRLVLALVLIAGCKGTDPARFGALKSRITDGRVQPGVVAGINAVTAVNLTYRDEIALRPTPLWERWALPPLAYAQSSALKVQPGAVACVREDQTDLIPLTRCVTADAQGNSRFDWYKTPTRAGTYRALVSATYGLEATQEDSVTVTIVAGPVDPLLSINWGPQPNGTSPATMFASSVVDVYGNPIPYRIDMGSDTALKVQGTVVGSTEARTVVFTNAFVDTVALAWRGPVSFRGMADTLLARGYYRIGAYNNQPAISWRVRGLGAGGP